MKHKNGIRSRPIDDKKQLKVIKDLAKAKFDADNESLKRNYIKYLNIMKKEKKLKFLKEK